MTNPPQLFAVDPNRSFLEGKLGPVFLCSADGQLTLRRMLPGETVVVGSSPEVEVRMVSTASRHALLRHTGSAIEVTDLGTESGTHYFGARIDRALARPPFSLSLGGVELDARTAPGADRDVSAPPLPGVIGDSEPMRKLASRVRRYAAVGVPVLVRGQTGVGKDLVARSLHELSPFRRGPFVVINAATISRELAESELFGHQKGAFTGASSARKGAFRQADEGTLFIDEIAALGLDVQAKLLRVVEDGAVRPLGTEETFPVRVRLVVATCEPLESMIDAGVFREDLYERLAVGVLDVPALHERPSDIPLLARHLLAVSGFPTKIAQQALAILATRIYRGNVRELRNILVQAALRTNGVIEAEDVRTVLLERSESRRRLSSVEAAHILEVCEGNMSKAARQARIPRSTLRGLLARSPLSPRLTLGL